MRYSAPLRDLSFVLNELLDAPAALAQMPEHAGLDGESLMAVAEQAGDFAAGAILPLNRGADETGCRWHGGEVEMPPGFQQAYRDYCELGWVSICAALADGGQGLPRLMFSVVNEIFSAASHAFVMIASVNHCAAICLRRSASPALQARWLPALASGRVLSSMCMTEPQAGSDIGLLSTRAEPEGPGGYRLSGSKIFASGAEHGLSENIVHLVLARIAGAPPGSRGLSLFLVPKWLDDGARNAVHCDGIEHKMGLHGSPTCALRLDGALGWLVGEPQRGLAAMFPMMNEARLMSGLQALGLSELAWQAARGYAHERRQGRSPAGLQPCPLVDHPDVQRMLMTQKAWNEGARMLVHWTALVIDAAESHADQAHRRESAELAGLLTPIVKGFLCENAQQALSLALQVHGGHGYVRETGVEQLVRDARVITLYEGSTGIQAQDLLMRKVLADGGQRLALLTGRVQAWLESPGAGAEGLAAFTGPLRTLLAQVRAATTLLAGRERGQAGAALASCCSYLRLLGHLVMAWWWARAAAACLAMQEDEHEHQQGWYAGKLATAHFHYGELLPETRALLAAIEAAPRPWALALAE